jgi:hypothetical protein
MLKVRPRLAGSGHTNGGRRRALEHACFGMLPGLVTGYALITALSGGWAAGDFRHSFLVAAWRAMHGQNTYSWTAADMRVGLSFPYPALTVLLLEPLVLLPTALASSLFVAFCIACAFVTLRVLAVQDWRVYGLLLLWGPVVIGWQTGNLTLPLVAGLALVWRYRERTVVVALLVTVLISVKPIMLPLGLWLLAMRRYRAAAHALAFGLLLNLLAWTVIGWGAISHWLDLLSLQSRVMYRSGYSVISLLAHLGVARAPATVAEILVAVWVAGWGWSLGRHRGDRQAFCMAVGLTLIASPQIDLHYFAVLIVPIGIARTRLSWPWLIPLVLWVCPATNPSIWQISIWWLIALIVLHDAQRPGIKAAIPWVLQRRRSHVMGRLAP